MSDLGDLQVHLRGELLQIHALWAEVRKQWNDTVSNSFHEQHLQPFEQALSDYIRALQKMAEVLDRAEKDACSCE